MRGSIVGLVSPYERWSTTRWGQRCRFARGAFSRAVLADVVLFNHTAPTLARPEDQAVYFFEDHRGLFAQIDLASCDRVMAEVAADAVRDGRATGFSMRFDVAAAGESSTSSNFGEVLTTYGCVERVHEISIMTSPNQPRFASTWAAVLPAGHGEGEAWSVMPKAFATLAADRDDAPAPRPGVPTRVGFMMGAVAPLQVRC